MDELDGAGQRLIVVHQNAVHVAEPRGDYAVCHEGLLRSGLKLSAVRCLSNLKEPCARCAKMTKNPRWASAHGRASGPPMTALIPNCSRRGIGAMSWTSSATGKSRRSLPN